MTSSTACSLTPVHEQVDASLEDNCTLLQGLDLSMPTATQSNATSATFKSADTEAQILKRRLKDVYQRQGLLKLKKKLQAAEEALAAEERQTSTAGATGPREQQFMTTRATTPSQRSRYDRAVELTREDCCGCVMVASPDFFAKGTEADATAFLRQCERVILARESHFVQDPAKVLFASSHLRGEAAEAWDKFEREAGIVPITWTQFKDFLQDHVRQSRIRLNATYETYKQARQTARQSVMAFAVFVDGLEALLPPYTEEQRYHHLLHGLRPELRDQIQRQESLPVSRIQLVFLAMKLEEAQTGDVCQPADERFLYGNGQGVENVISTRASQSGEARGTLHQEMAMEVKDMQWEDISQSSRQLISPTPNQDHNQWLAPREEERPPRGDHSGRGPGRSDAQVRKQRREKLSQTTTTKKTKGACHHCGKYSHLAKDCWHPPQIKDENKTEPQW